MTSADRDDRGGQEARSRLGRAGITHGGDQPPRVVLHLGFHKTGTTALQRSMTQRLDEEGLVERWTYQCKQEGPMTDPIGALRELRRRPGDEYAQDVTAALRESFDRLLADRDTALFISDETLLGPPAIGEQVLYPHVERLLTPLAEALNGLPTEVIVVVRRQPEFLESMYIQSVQQGSPLPFDTFIKRARTDTLCWTHVLTRVRTTLNRPLTVVPYEYLTGLDRGVIGWFDGRLGIKESFGDGGLRRNVGLSEKGLLAALGAYPALARPERHELRMFLQRKYPATATTRPRLLTDRGRGQLLAALAEDNDLLFTEFVTDGHGLADFYAPSVDGTGLDSNSRDTEIEVAEIWRDLSAGWHRWSPAVDAVRRDDPAEG